MAASEKRLEGLLKELDFLDLCALLLLFSKKTTMNFKWKHPEGVTVEVKQPRKKK